MPFDHVRVEGHERRAYLRQEVGLRRAQLEQVLLTAVHAHRDDHDLIVGVGGIEAGRLDVELKALQVVEDQSLEQRASGFDQVLLDRRRNVIKGFAAVPSGAHGIQIAVPGRESDLEAQRMVAREFADHRRRSEL